MRHDPLQAGSQHTAECTPEKCNLLAAFPSCFEPHYESKPKRKPSRMKISFHSYANKTNLLIKIFPLNLAFIMRFKATRKWPIVFGIVAVKIF